MPREKSRVWFITGCSQGIGRALLDALLEADERVVATLRRPEKLAFYIEKYPTSQLLVLPLDVTSTEQIDQVFAKVKEHFGRIDIVVNNAGFGLVAEIEGMPEDEARQCFETCFWGPFHICQRAIPFMRDVNPPGVGGRLINVSSAGGYSACPTLSIYSSAKFALEGLTESLRKEMDPSWNITGIIVELGGFRTEWAGDSLKTLPPLPQYSPNSPSCVFRKASFNPSTYIGDPAKVGQAFIKVAGMPDPPLRVQFGTESMAIVMGKARETLQNAEKYADISHSTNMEGVDEKTVLQRFEMYIAQ